MPTSLPVHTLASLVLVLALGAWAPQQEAPPPPDTVSLDQSGAETRTAKLLEARRERRRALEPPEEPSRLETVIAWLEEQRESLRANYADADVLNISPVLGGLRTGADLTAGLRLDLSREESRRLLTVAARASIERYWGLKAQAGYDPGTYFGYAFAQYRHMPQEDFYGIGFASPSFHTDFRRDEFVGGGLGGVRLHPRLLAGAGLSYMTNRLGPGHNDDLPDARDRFAPTEVPALTQGIDYAIAGAFAEADWRDQPPRRQFGERFAPTRRRLRGLSLEARRGIYAAVEVSHYADQAGGDLSFTRGAVDLHQYVPFRNGYHVIALRELLTVTHVPAGNEVPFYLLPTLGGKRTIRGFSSHRFRDLNAWLVNVEYRYQVWRLLDVALFADIGQIFHEGRDAALRHAEAGYGAGLRLRTRKELIARVDLAHSREGFALELSLSSIL